MFRKSADFAKILFHHPLTNCQSAAWSILRPPHFILVSFLELCTQLFTVECQPFQCHKQTSNISVFQCLSSTKRSWKIRRSIVLANLKNSSCALLDLTRSEWFLPRWRSELLLRRKGLNDLTKTKGWWRSGSKKKFQTPFPPASPHCERNRQDFKGRKLQRSEKFSSTRQLVRYCAATRILPALRRESISMLGVQLQLAATTSAPSSTWPLWPLGPIFICAVDGAWSIKLCLTRRLRGFYT